MNDLPELALDGTVIIEHHTDGTNVVGRVQHAQLNRDASMRIQWHSKRFGVHATIFQPKSWKTDVIDGVVFFTRIAPDEGDHDVPRHTADLYIVVPHRA